MESSCYCVLRDLSMNYSICSTSYINMQAAHGLVWRCVSQCSPDVRKDKICHTFAAQTAALLSSAIHPLMYLVMLASVSDLNSLLCKW